MCVCRVRCVCPLSKVHPQGRDSDLSQDFDPCFVFASLLKFGYLTLPVDSRQQYSKQYVVVSNWSTCQYR